MRRSAVKVDVEFAATYAWIWTPAIGVAIAIRAISTMMWIDRSRGGIVGVAVALGVNAASVVLARCRWCFVIVSMLDFYFRTFYVSNKIITYPTFTMPGQLFNLNLGN